VRSDRSDQQTADAACRRDCVLARCCAHLCGRPDFHRPAQADVQSYVREPLTGTTNTPVVGDGAKRFKPGVEVPAGLVDRFRIAFDRRPWSSALPTHPTLEIARAALRRRTSPRGAVWYRSYRWCRRLSAQPAPKNGRYDCAHLELRRTGVQLHTAQVAVGRARVVRKQRRAVESSAAQEQSQALRRSGISDAPSNVVAAAIQQAGAAGASPMRPKTSSRACGARSSCWPSRPAGYASGLDVARRNRARPGRSSCCRPQKTARCSSRELLRLTGVAGASPGGATRPGSAEAARGAAAERCLRGWSSHRGPRVSGRRGAGAFGQCRGRRGGSPIACRSSRSRPSMAAARRSLQNVFATTRFWTIRATSLRDFVLRNAQRHASGGRKRHWTGDAQNRSVALTAFRLWPTSLYGLEKKRRRRCRCGRPLPRGGGPQDAGS